MVHPEENTAPNSRLGSPSLSTAVEKVVIDPSKGGAISPKTTGQSKALQVDGDVWIWDGVVKVLEVDLFSASWEVRHGAAMGLRELLKLQGRCGGMRGGCGALVTSLVLINFADDLSALENEIAHEKWCNDLAAQLLCIFVLDRFSDFITDQV